MSEAKYVHEFSKEFVILGIEGCEFVYAVNQLFIYSVICKQMEASQRCSGDRRCPRNLRPLASVGLCCRG